MQFETLGIVFVMCVRVIGVLEGCRRVVRAVSKGSEVCVEVAKHDGMGVLIFASNGVMYI